jgi:hypothetical protein
MHNLIHRPRGFRPLLLAILALQAFAIVMPAIHGFDAVVIAQEQGGGNQGGNQGGQQGGGLDVDVDIDSGPDQAVWYTQWWMWAIGVAVFLIVVIALTRGRSAG